MKIEGKIKKIREDIIHMADLITEMDSLVEKSNIFANDLVISYFEEADFDTEKGRLTAQYDFHIAEAKANAVCDYTSLTAEKIRNLLAFTNKTLSEITK